MCPRPDDNFLESEARPERLLTEKSLAERWQISVKTLQNARVKGGGVRFLKLGRAVRYRLGDVLQYETANARASTSDRGGK